MEDMCQWAENLLHFRDQGAYSHPIHEMYQFAETIQKHNKTPGSNGFTIEFYRFFWDSIGQIMVDSFNNAFENGDMSISQKRGIVSLHVIPKKDRDESPHWTTTTKSSQSH